jgi:hypothetical protein
MITQSSLEKANDERFGERLWKNMVKLWKTIYKNSMIIGWKKAHKLKGVDGKEKRVIVLKEGCRLG